MKKSPKKSSEASRTVPEFLKKPGGLAMRNSRFDMNIENLKRRGALPRFSLFEDSSRSFFDRILNVKKIRDIIFVPKARTKNR